MTDSIEIPDLYDPHLMELSVCGEVRTKNKSVLADLKKLDAGRMTALVGDFVKGEAELYVQLFGAGAIKNHLHVNVLIRPQNWAKKTNLSSIKEVRDSLQLFLGLTADLLVRGEFLIPVSELPRTCFIRSAMKEARIDGLKARRTGENFTFKSHPHLFRLGWSEFGKDHVVVNLDIQETTKIGAEYLLNSKISVLKAFRTLILAEKQNATSNK